MKFHPLNEQAQSFPKSKLSILPLFSFSFLGISFKTKSFSTFSSASSLHVDGRSALAHALRLLEHSNKNTVLFPAYHCGSMIEPAIWLSTNLYFYKVNKDLSPDLNHIKQLIAQAKQPVKTVVIVHYFGFFQPLDAIVKLCKEHDIKLIEDCAHAYYRPNNQVNAPRGDLAIASPRKFFPIPDGGLLTINNASILKSVTLTSLSIKAEIKSLYNCLETTKLYPKPSILGQLLATIDNIRTLPHNASSVSEVPPSAHKPDFLWFDPEKVNQPGSCISKLLIRYSTHQTIIKCRRENYLYLFNKLNQLANAYPLYALTTQTVPYMLPLVITAPEQQFFALKQLGMPIWRWEELAESDCEHSQYYRTHLLHLPCHQSLTNTDLNWMITQLRHVLGSKIHTE